jgi:LPS O-antigen subunit length determinant protein (WzzB/FepE family)
MILIHGLRAGKFATRFPARERRLTRKKFFGFVFGGLVGAAIGAGVALLFAPESGEELRADIRERGDKVVGEIKDAAAMRRAQLQDRLNTLRHPAPSSATD